MGGECFLKYSQDHDRTFISALMSERISGPDCCSAFPQLSPHLVYEVPDLSCYEAVKVSKAQLITWRGKGR